MNRHQALKQWAQIQNKLHKLVQPLTDNELRTQYHHDLSPLGWHLGHCAFIDAYWTYEKVLEDNTLTQAHHTLYFPENTP